MIIVRTKKIIMILMLIIFALCFCACGQINSAIVNNLDSSIDEVVTINLNKKEIENAGKTVDEIKNYSQAKAKIIIDNYIISLNNKIALDLLTAEAKDVVRLNGYINGITPINSYENGTLKLGIKFKNRDVYKYYYGINDNSSTEAEIEKHFFYDKAIYKGNTLYARHASLYAILKQDFEADYPELKNNINSEVNYTNIVDKRREHSDADVITRVGDKYYHTWKVDINNPQDKEIVMYYCVANAGNCILIAIVVALIIGSILGVVAIIIVKKNNKNKSKENLEENK